MSTCYPEMTNTMIARVETAGFGIGTRVVVGNKIGVVAAINPLFFDEQDPIVYVDYGPDDRHHMVNISILRHHAQEDK